MFTLVIAGRPNVGKSTFFNRLAGKQLAIVHDEPGVTRDWRDAEARLGGQRFRIIDTAGLEEAFDESIPARMRAQSEAAIELADAILFMTDAREGITASDQHFARWLRKQGKPVIACVNKCETVELEQQGVADAYQLGLGEALAVSSEHGIGFDQLYDILEPFFEQHETEEQWDDRDDEDIVPDDIDAVEGDEEFDFEDDAEEEEKALKLAIAGRPNVGKSTLMNALLGEQRSMTGPEAGVTRDAVHAELEYEGRRIRLVDTAGMRRRARITEKLEGMAVADSLRAIRLAQVVVMMIDGTEGLKKQDLQIAAHVVAEGRSLILAVNKWDLVENKKERRQEILDGLENSFAQVKNVTLVTLSALHGKNTELVIKEVLRTYDLWNTRVKTGPLNRWLAGMESHHPAPLVGGHPNRLRYITQIKSRPPSFALWVSRPKALPESYKRYIIGGLRESFDLDGVPIRLFLRTSKNPYN